MPGDPPLSRGIPVSIVPLGRSVSDVFEVCENVLGKRLEQRSYWVSHRSILQAAVLITIARTASMFVWTCMVRIVGQSSICSVPMNEGECSSVHPFPC
jgi:hypothetical protein